MRNLDEPRPKVKDVFDDLKALRKGRGITVDRLRDKQHILRLTAVLADAKARGQEDDLAPVAFALIDCVLTKSTVIPEKSRSIVAMEINIDESEDPDYTERKKDILVKWNLFGVDYRNVEREAYTRVAMSMVALDRSPCSPSPEAAAVEARFRKLREFVNDQQKMAIALLSEHYGKAESIEEAEDISRRLLEALPSARAALRRIGYQPSRPFTAREVVDHLFAAVLANEYGLWKNVSPNDVMNALEVRVGLGYFDVPDSERGSQASYRADGRWVDSLRLLGMVVSEVEAADDWPRVLAPGDSREPSAALA